MPAEIFWIQSNRLNGRLAIMPRPRAGDWLEDELKSLRAVGVDHVVSLIEAHEVHELGLAREGELCRAAGMAFMEFPIVDRGVPDSARATADLAMRLKTLLDAGDAVAIHCRAGIGRSSLVAASVMVQFGHGVDESFALITAARGVAVPDTRAQHDWVRALPKI